MRFKYLFVLFHAILPIYARYNFSIKLNHVCTWLSEVHRSRFTTTWATFELPSFCWELLSIFCLSPVLENLSTFFATESCWVHMLRSRLSCLKKDFKPTYLSKKRRFTYFFFCSPWYDESISSNSETISSSFSSRSSTKLFENDFLRSCTSWNTNVNAFQIFICLIPRNIAYLCEK